MRERMLTEVTLRLLFLIKDDDVTTRGECLEFLNAWNDVRYDIYNQAEDKLIKAGLIKRADTGQGIEYRLTTQGVVTRIEIQGLAGLLL